MNNIETHAQLMAEIRRLELMKQNQELAIQSKIQTLKGDLEPAQLVPEMISNVLFNGSQGGGSGLLFKAVNSGIVFLAENVLLKKSPAIIKAAVAMAVGNVTADALSKNSPVIYKHAGDLLRKIKHFVSADNPDEHHKNNGTSAVL